MQHPSLRRCPFAQTFFFPFRITTTKILFHCFFYLRLRNFRFNMNFSNFNIRNSTLEILNIKQYVWFRNPSPFLFWFPFLDFYMIHKASSAPFQGRIKIKFLSFWKKILFLQYSSMNGFNSWSIYTCPTFKYDVISILLLSTNQIVRKLGD